MKKSRKPAIVKTTRLNCVAWNDVAPKNSVVPVEDWPSELGIANFVHDRIMYVQTVQTVKSTLLSGIDRTAGAVRDAIQDALACIEKLPPEITHVILN